MKEYIVRCDNNKFTLEGEIVRCKDCEFCIVEEPISRGIIPDIYCRIWQSNVSTDDSCSYAERKEKVQLSPETSTNGSYIRDGRLMHDLVYRGEAEVETPTNAPTDLISRQAAIDAVEKAVFKGVAKSAIESLPPVEPKPVCEDAISRADTIKAICRECTQEGRDECREDCTEVAVVRGMPPVEPERPKGEWIDDDKINHKYHRCSECGLGRFNWGEDNFCPNCGADCRGDKE